MRNQLDARCDVGGGDGHANAQAPVPAHPVQPGADLLEILIELENYGRPRLGKYDTGWTCAVEMNTAHKGADFTIRSSFDMKSPMAAALECLERVVAATGDRRSV